MSREIGALWHHSAFHTRNLHPLSLSLSYHSVLDATTTYKHQQTPALAEFIRDSLQKGVWPATLAFYTHYTESSLTECTQCMLALLADNDKTAVCKKFATIDTDNLDNLAEVLMSE